MGYPPAEALDLISMLELALDDASSVLQRAAIDLGAEAAAVLFSAGSQVELTYWWGELGDCASKQQMSIAKPGRFDVLKTTTGPVDAGNPLAQVLREFVSPQSQSFLLFPWQMQRRVVTVVFCFAAPRPAYTQAPDAVIEKLRLIGLATWSVKEIAGLRSELRTVTNRLAGRKLVERAKGVLQIDHGISEAGAYEHLRRLSRKRRITLAALAEEVIRERRETDAQSRKESGAAENSLDITGRQSL
jgi:ANTAR domain